MLMQEVTPEMVAKWKVIYNEYKTQLNPNKKTAPELIEYLEEKYPITEQTEEKLIQVIIDNVLQNEFYAKKLPEGKGPRARVFCVENRRSGESLYEEQDEIFKVENMDNIIVGIELETTFFMVEGSSILWDELFAFRGLDVDDLNNYYLVAEYITCLKKYGMLDNVLSKKN